MDIMNRKRLYAPFIFFAVLLAAHLTAVSGQNKEEKPSFTGTWTLEKVISKHNYKTIESSPNAKVILNIAHTDPELKIEESKTTASGANTTTNSLYFTDGRGEVRIIPALISIGVDSKDIRSQSAVYKVEFKTKWNKQKIVSKGLVVRSVSVIVQRIETVEEWEMSEDGSELIHTIKQIIPANPNAKRVVPSSSGNNAILMPARDTVVEEKFIFKRVKADSAN